jgi:hypothetical protein
MKRVAAGIHQDWLLKDRISVYTITEIGVASFVALSEDIIQVIEEKLVHSSNFGVFFDITAPGVGIPFLALTSQNIFDIGLTNIGRQKVRTLLQKHPEFRIYLAISVSTNLSGKITSGRAANADRTENIVPHLFYDRDSALSWLEGQLNSAL